MNRAQRKQVLLWAIGLLPLCIGGIEYRWVLANWNWLKWLTFSVIFLVAKLGGKEARGWGEPDKNVIDFLDEHPLLKVWVVFDALCIFLFIVYGLSHGIEFDESPGLWLLLGFGPLFLPLFAVAEYQRFKRLGEQPNPTRKPGSERISG